MKKPRKPNTILLHLQNNHIAANCNVDEDPKYDQMIEKEESKLIEELVTSLDEGRGIPFEESEAFKKRCLEKGVKPEFEGLLWVLGDGSWC